MIPTTWWSVLWGLHHCISAHLSQFLWFFFFLYNFASFCFVVCVVRPDWLFALSISSSECVQFATFAQIFDCLFSFYNFFFIKVWNLRVETREKVFRIPSKVYWNIYHPVYLKMSVIVVKSNNDYFVDLISHRLNLECKPQ